MYAGDYEAAYRTALRLIEYDDVITPKICYSLLALVSYYANHFGSCSRAFVKLETLESTAVNTVGGKPSWQLEEPDSFERLGGDIFTKNLPLDPAMLRLPCMHCQTLVDDW
jgi:WD repeat-containing protein 35